jgi:hypothetical protein
MTSPLVLITEVKPMMYGTLNQENFYTGNTGPCSTFDEALLKNALCPYYDNCLDWALKENWRQFTCKDCDNQDYHIEIYPDAGEMRGYYRLLDRIFTG